MMIGQCRHRISLVILPSCGRKHSRWSCNEDVLHTLPITKCLRTCNYFINCFTVFTLVSVAICLSYHSTNHRICPSICKALPHDPPLRYVHTFPFSSLIIYLCNRSTSRCLRDQMTKAKVWKVSERILNQRCLPFISRWRWDTEESNFFASVNSRLVTISTYTAEQ